MSYSIIINIPYMVKLVGYWATMRWICNLTGCNEQTAMRCIQAANLCEVNV